MVSETCDWLTQPASAWLAESVTKAVEIEFDRFISAGDLAQTVLSRDRCDMLRHGTKHRHVAFIEGAGGS